MSTATLLDNTTSTTPGAWKYLPPGEYKFSLDLSASDSGVSVNIEERHKDDSKDRKLARTLTEADPSWLYTSSGEEVRATLVSPTANATVLVKPTGK